MVACTLTGWGSNFFPLNFNGYDSIPEIDYQHSSTSATTLEPNKEEMLTQDNYGGVIAYPPTPFLPDFSLDEQSFRTNIKRLIGAGVSGIAVAGTSGECYTLSDDELDTMCRILTEETRSSGVVSIVGATGLSTGEAIERARIAQAAGVDGAMLIQPYYSPLTEDELQLFWEEVCAAVPDLGVLVYHYDWVRQPYSADTYRRLSAIPNLVGSKEAHWDFGMWKNLHNTSPLKHMSSTDTWTVELIQLGAVGVGTLNVSYMPHVIAGIVDAARSGDIDGALRLQGRMTELLSTLKLGKGMPRAYPIELEGWETYSNSSRHKALTDAFGFLTVGTPRRPAIRVSESLRGALRGYLERHFADLLPVGPFPEDVIREQLWPITS